jgi:DNA-binding MarR family transcriptional regulator
MPAARHPEHDLAYLLSRASHQLTQRLCTILEEEGLTLGQWWVLQLLSDGTRHGMSDAADYAMLPPPSLTKAVDQLVLAWIHRVPAGGWLDLIMRKAL